MNSERRKLNIYHLSRPPESNNRDAKREAGKQLRPSQMFVHNSERSKNYPSVIGALFIVVKVLQPVHVLKKCKL